MGPTPAVSGHNVRLVTAIPGMGGENSGATWNWSGSRITSITSRGRSDSRVPETQQMEKQDQPHMANPPEARWAPRPSRTLMIERTRVARATEKARLAQRYDGSRQAPWTNEEIGILAAVVGRPEDSRCGR
jgi:hypothetical protein